MDLDLLLVSFFGSADFARISPAQLATGVERLQIEFGMEKDRGRRFALWSLMYLLDIAPDLDVAFKDEADREAARDFMDMADQELADEE